MIKKMKNNIFKTLALFVMCLSLPVFAQTQDAAATTDVAAAAGAVASASSTAVKAPSIDSYIPWILVTTALALGIVILFMGSLLSKVAIMKMKSNLKSLVIIILSTAAISLNAATEKASGWSVSSGQLNYMLLGVIFFEVLIILYFAYWLKVIVLPQTEEVKPKVTASNAWWDKFNKSVKIEDEKDVQLDHDYDGIKELDNALPPWWLYGFYLTIVFAGIYIWRFHFSDAPLQVQELKNEIAAAKVAEEAYAKMNANKVDENSVVYKADPALIAAGKELFASKCVACHGAEAGGGQGPNLTDDYWIHGGSIKDIFKTIKYGVTNKGMIAWGGELTPKQIEGLANFIKSIKGSNPKGGLPKAGELYIEEGAAADSSANTQAAAAPAVNTK
jgi:cytochrome c oxidase cbb3-type subunit 3